MDLAFIYPALPTCLVVYVQKSDFHLINVFCVVIAIKNVDYYARPPREILPGGTKIDTGPPGCWSPVETFIACWYSNQNKDNTVTIPRFTNRLIVIVATSPVAARGHVPQVFVMCPQIVLCPEKRVLKILIKTNIFPP